MGALLAQSLAIAAVALFVVLVVIIWATLLRLVRDIALLMAQIRDDLALVAELVRFLLMGAPPDEDIGGTE